MNLIRWQHMSVDAELFFHSCALCIWFSYFVLLKYKIKVVQSPLQFLIFPFTIVVFNNCLLYLDFHVHKCLLNDEPLLFPDNRHEGITPRWALFQQWEKSSEQNHTDCCTEQKVRNIKSWPLNIYTLMDRCNGCTSNVCMCYLDNHWNCGVLSRTVYF